MIFRTLKVIAVVAVMAIGSPAVAQHCGGGHGGGQSCGRAPTVGYAASLWADYCTESCEYQGGSACGSPCGGNVYGGAVYSGVDCGNSGAGGGCRLGGKLRGLFSGFGGLGGGFGSGCGCDNGCFGYPAGGCCGGGLGFTDMGGFGGIRASLFGGHSGGACRGGGCKLFGKLLGGGGGCGLFSRLHGNRGGFSTSREMVGSTDAYFTEMVGYDYGNAGMQSVVSGVASQCCDGQSAGYVDPDSMGGMSYGAPIPAAGQIDPSYNNYGHGQIHNHGQSEHAIGSSTGANAQEIVGEAVQETSNGASALQKAKEAVEALENAVN